MFDWILFLLMIAGVGLAAYGGYRIGYDNAWSDAGYYLDTHMDAADLRRARARAEDPRDGVTTLGAVLRAEGRPATIDGEQPTRPPYERL